MTGPIDVLLGDDDIPNAEYLRQLLGSLGFRARAAATKAKTWEMFLDRDPNSVILDRNFPDGNGTDLIPAIRSHRPSVRIAVLSGDADPPDAAGADAVFLKGSVTADQLVAALAPPRARGPEEPSC